MERPCACLGGSRHPAGRQSQRQFVPEKEGPGEGRRGQLASAGAQFSHSSHNPAHPSFWASFLYNLLQTSTWPEPRLRQAQSSLRPASCVLISHNEGSEQTAQVGVAENLPEAPGEEQEFGFTH